MRAVLLQAAPFLALGWAVAAITMSGLWVLGRGRRNYGVVDVGWTYLVAALAIVFTVLGPGATPRRWIVGSMFLIWGLRLGTYLLWDRVIGRPEDGRYATLRQSWGNGPGGAAAADRRFFWFFQAQALAAVLFALPSVFPAINPATSLSGLEWAAATLWLAAVVGESAADWQLTRFKRTPGTRGRTCRVGLWRYSRHPNYFFEWLVWVAYALFAVASPAGSIAFACPAVMLYLLFRVTGIPATEAQAIHSRGRDYLDYQATTSAFVPWFPRRTLEPPQESTAHS